MMNGERLKHVGTFGKPLNSAAGFPNLSSPFPGYEYLCTLSPLFVASPPLLTLFSLLKNEGKDACIR